MSLYPPVHHRHLPLDNMYVVQQAGPNFKLVLDRPGKFLAGPFDL